MDTATIVFLPAGAEVRAEQGVGGEARRALDAWAEARGLRLVDPESAPVPALSVDMALADRVEEQLAHARDALTAQDRDGTDRALARAEGLLRAHPELPNASWLMAEVDRGWAVRWSRLAADADRARTAWKSAGALDGGRIAGVGEAASALDPPVPTTLILEGDGEAWLDGARVTPGDLSLLAGEHQLLLKRSGAVLWAEWVTFSAHEAVRVAVPEPAPCSTQDLARAYFDGGAIYARGVQCVRWVAASTATAATGTEPRSVLVTTCERAGCGALVEWTLRGAPTHDATTASPVATTHTWPAWATWTLVGVGVAAAAVGVTLAATGAFRSSPSGTEFVSGGLQMNAHPLLAWPGP